MDSFLHLIMNLMRHISTDSGKNGFANVAPILCLPTQHFS